MANMLFANNCNTTLASSLTSGATSMSVTSATGFPVPTGSQYFYCTLADAATQTTIEIVKVTAVSGTTFTIVRGQDGTSGAAFASGAVVSLRLVSASLNDFPKLDENNTFTFAPTFNTALGVASGGTGLTTLTAGYLPYGNGTSAFSSSSGLTFNGTVLTATNITTSGYLTVTGGSSWAIFNNNIGGVATSANTGVMLGWNASSGGGDAAIVWGKYYTGTAPLRFLSSDGSTLSEAMRISASGGVSIGNTTDPGAGNLLVNTNLFVGTTAALGSSVCTFMNNSQYAGPQIVVRNNYNTAGKYWKIGQENNNSLAFYIYNASGVGQYMTDGGTSWLPNVSDERLKNKISDISNALEAVNKLKPLSFYYQNQEQSGIPNYGHFAQDVGNAIPDAMLVSPQKDDALGDIYTYDPNIINIYLVKAVQELSAKFDAYVASHP